MDHLIALTTFRRLHTIIFIILAIGMISLSAVYSQTTQTFPKVNKETQATSVEFFKSIIGDWVGLCDQSTNGQKADCKYFQVNMSQADSTTFKAAFKYFRFDPSSHTSTKDGTINVTIVIQPDGSVKNNLKGDGTVFVDGAHKPQNHQLEETLTYLGDGKFSGKMRGKINVSDVPLGLGKNGNVAGSTSTWTLENGELKINQNISVGYKVLMFNKSYRLIAHNTARRGTDVMALMLNHTEVATSASHSQAGG